jgi:hypothetical protein
MASIASFNFANYSANGIHRQPRRHTELAARASCGIGHRENKYLMPFATQRISGNLWCDPPCALTRATLAADRHLPPTPGALGCLLLIMNKNGPGDVSVAQAQLGRFFVIWHPSPLVTNASPPPFCPIKQRELNQVHADQAVKGDWREVRQFCSDPWDRRCLVRG